jgi:hypothetical protein
MYRWNREHPEPLAGYNLAPAASEASGNVAFSEIM